MTLFNYLRFVSSRDVSSMGQTIGKMFFPIVKKVPKASKSIHVEKTTSSEKAIRSDVSGSPSKPKVPTKNTKKTFTTTNKMVARAPAPRKSTSKSLKGRKLPKTTTHTHTKAQLKRLNSKGSTQKAQLKRGGVWFGGDSDMCGSIPLLYNEISIPSSLPVNTNISHMNSPSSVSSGQESLLGTYSMTTSFPTPTASTNMPFIL